MKRCLAFWITKMARGLPGVLQSVLSRRALTPLFSTLLLLTPMVLGAEVAPVTVHVSNPRPWIGERVPIFVELRAPGLFVGTPRFELPQLPGTLLMKIGEPTVSSEEIDGQSWFVQSHEFALFSQKPGPLEVPDFPVSFDHRTGFTGPVTSVAGQTSSVTIELLRPPGSESIGFLVTTESLEVTEIWDPEAGFAEVGALFKRTILQRAPNLPGMALAPASANAPDGIKVYHGDPQTKDNFERGNFLGERSETLTYLVQRPGSFALPALTYVWWDPKAETLKSTTLPAVTFEVAAPPAVAASSADAGTRRLWPWLLVLAITLGSAVWQWRLVSACGRQGWKKLNPPDRVAARELLRACRRNDAAAAVKEWIKWQNTRGNAFQCSPRLSDAVAQLHRSVFCAVPASQWEGDEFILAFRENASLRKTGSSDDAAAKLPLLNPSAE